MKKSCGIYELKNEKGRISYKIFADIEDLQRYLKKNKGKTCEDMKPVFSVKEYREYVNTQVRKLTVSEIQKYLSER
ncbi:hypothetical protein [Streptococcus ruminantium]